MTKQLLITTVFILFSLMAIGQTADDDFFGKWKTPEGKIVLIAKTETGFIGVTEKDRTVVLEVKFVDNKWKGTITRPVDGTKASCELKLVEDYLEIVASKAMFTKTIRWTRP